LSQIRTPEIAILDTQPNEYVPSQGGVDIGEEGLKDLFGILLVYFGLVGRAIEIPRGDGLMT
jgi:hypothetical protein